MNDNDDWGAYRKLFEEDRKVNADNFKEVFGRLDAISTQLTELKTQRNTYGWIGNLVLTGVIAAIVAWFTPSQ